VDSSYAFL
jgi:hypothetical protein